MGITNLNSVFNLRHLKAVLTAKLDGKIDRCINERNLGYDNVFKIRYKPLYEITGLVKHITI